MNATWTLIPVTLLLSAGCGSPGTTGPVAIVVSSDVPVVVDDAPDGSAAPVPGGGGMAYDGPVHDTVEELVGASELVVVATVTAVGEPTAKFADEFQPEGFAVTEVELEIERSVSGAPPSSGAVLLDFLGTRDAPGMRAIPTVGEELMLFLVASHGADTRATYGAVATLAVEADGRLAFHGGFEGVVYDAPGVFLAGRSAADVEAEIERVGASG